MRVYIREGKMDDLPAVYELVRQLAVYEREPEAVTATLEAYREDFANERFEVLVAALSDEIVGMALFYYAFSTWKGRMYYLEDFVVREEYRGKGIGKALFAKFLDVAQRKGARLVKWQVLDWNEPAIQFYQKHGAIIERDWLNGKLFFEQPL